jgi:hypothetical protein
VIVQQDAEIQHYIINVQAAAGGADRKMEWVKVYSEPQLCSSI